MVESTAMDLFIIVTAVCKDVVVVSVKRNRQII